MTSGSFSTIPVSTITVERDSRQRRELTGIDELADSIRRIGLIHPLTVDRSHLLIAGERRLTAIRLLGLPTVAVQYIEDLSLRERREIELEENVKRVDMPWIDQVNAVREYHSIRQESTPDWSGTDTASALGISHAVTMRMLAVANEIASGNEMVATAPKLSTAIGITERAAARRKDNAVADLHRIVGTDNVPLRQEPESDRGPILNADLLGSLATYDGPRYNFIHCDFPYGINADKHAQGSAATHGGYIDTPDTYRTLLANFLDGQDAIVADSAHCMFWFAMKYYTETVEIFDAHGWTVNPMPLIWHKTDGSGIIPDPQRGPRQCYETALLCTRGDRKIVRAKANIYGCGIATGHHMSEKPESMLRHFMEMFVDGTTSCLDPTSGSGSALRAADSLGASTVRGYEINPIFASDANRRFLEARNARSVPGK